MVLNNALCIYFTKIAKKHEQSLYHMTHGLNGSISSVTYGRLILRLISGRCQKRSLVSLS